MGAGPGLLAGIASSFRRPGIAGVALVAPAILLLVIVLVVPIARFLALSVSNPEVPSILPATVAALAGWDGRDLPPHEAFGALAADLRRAAGNSEIGTLARRLNFEMPGARTLILRTATRLQPDAADIRSELIQLDPRWGERQIWAVLKRESGRFTPFYFLAAADLRQGPDGSVERVPENQRIFLDVLGRTFAISAATTLLCLLLGYPAAHLLAHAPARWNFPS